MPQGARAGKPDGFSLPPIRDKAEAMSKHEQIKLARKRRLSVALRENLKRRKAQVRGRGTAKPRVEETSLERKTNDDSKP